MDFTPEKSARIRNNMLAVNSEFIQRQQFRNDVLPFQKSAISCFLCCSDRSCAHVL
jgi:hypothetical protein